MVQTAKAVDVAQELNDEGVRAVARVDGNRPEVEIRGVNAVIPHKVCQKAAEEPRFSLVNTFEDRLVLR
jgi:hypothetical protein